MGWPDGSEAAGTFLGVGLGIGGRLWKTRCYRRPGGCPKDFSVGRNQCGWGWSPTYPGGHWDE